MFCFTKAFQKTLIDTLYNKTLFNIIRRRSKNNQAILESTFRTL